MTEDLIRPGAAPQMASDVNSVEVIRGLEGVRHGFLGRRGGVSTGVVGGLNTGLGSIGDGGDSAQAVAENRARAVMAVAPGASLVTLYQVHSARCVAADLWPEAERPHADALVTDRPGLVLGILTADCAPVLLADVQAGVVGAAHAGWQGALGGVCEATVAAMVAAGAQAGRITAAIGPCIAQASYEVDGGFYRRFCDQSADNAAFFVASTVVASTVRPGPSEHWHFDLPAYVAHRLRAAGLTQITTLALDTYADDTRFFSYRRATHRQEPAYGRQMSLIALAA